MMAVRPALQAILLAEQVYKEQTTGKHVVVGTFSNLAVEEFPCRLATPIFVFCALTNVSSRVEVSMRLLDASADVVMSSSALTIYCENPLLTIELSFPIESLSVPMAGWYRCELLVNARSIGAARLKVTRATRDEGRVGNQINAHDDLIKPTP